MRSLTRKELAKIAGVSERHLATLEQGEGNPSILVLLQLADALQGRLSELIDGEAAQRELRRDHRIALIGLRGAGKSTLGRMLADHLRFPFIELGTIIANSAGVAPSEFHVRYGASTYRQYERRALDDIAHAHAEAVVAVPGGLVLERENFGMLLSSYHTVWVRAAPEEHLQRVVDQGDRRPMATTTEALADIRKILSERSDSYSRADECVDTSGRRLLDSFADLQAKVASFQIRD